MNARRWIPIALILLASLSGGGALAFGPIVRAQASARAQRYGLSLHVGSTRPALFGVRLKNVTVSIPDVPSLSVQLDDVFVNGDEISVDGGTVTIRGERATFADQLQRWRSRSPAASSTSSTAKPSTIVSTRAVSLAWPDVDGPGSSLNLQDLRIDDLLGARSITAGRVELRHRRGSLDGEGLTVAWSRDTPPRVQSLRGKKLRAELRLNAKAIEPPAPATSCSAALPSSPPSSPPSGPPSAPPSAQPASSLSNAGLPSRDTTPIRDQLSRLAFMAWARLTPDAKLEVDAFEVQLHRGEEKINIGPGILAAQQKDNTVLIDLAPRVEEGTKGITFRASVPMSDGPVILDVVGGPISLATLGVQEGNLGLVGVADAQLITDAHLKLHADGKNLSFDGTMQAKNVSVKHWRLAPEAVRGLELAVKARGQVALDGSFVRVDEGEVDVGKVQLRLRGTVDRTNPKMRVDVHFGIPLVGCQAFLDALPQTLIPDVHGMTAAGTLSLDGHLRYDEQNLKDFFLEYAAGNDCRITSVPAAVDVRRFSAPFNRRVFDTKGHAVELEAGPGTPGWVGRGGTNHFIEAAVMTCEDGRFRRHRGFDHEAIHNSVRENLKAGKFLRGASTISMQLAKNLYLSRDKTISRKLQELILTTYLEQALTKDQIMELYLNVVEFGPMSYGIGNAASRYFHTHPARLSLGQSMYLASILPNPSQQHFVQDGRVSDGWMRYLYKLMKIAAKMRWISEVELEYGLGEWVVYGSPDPVRVDPEPGADGAEKTDPSTEEEEPFGWRQRGETR